MELRYDLSEADVMEAIKHWIITTQDRVASSATLSVYMTSHVGSDDPRQPSSAYTTASVKVT